jgi:hypothetical protein
MMMGVVNFWTYYLCEGANPMKNKTIFTLILCLLVSLALACGNSAPTAAPTSTPDVQATVDAAMAATSAAQAGMQATVDSAMAATSVSMPPTPTPGPTVEYVEMTEEELEALINQAVEDAVVATQEASATTTQATADDSLTYDEAQTVDVYVYAAEQALAYADELIGAYYSLYGELATETVDLLLAVESDLDEMAASMYAITDVLAAVEDDLAQGVAMTAEALLQLENASQQASANLEQVQSHVQTWAQGVQSEREDRASAIAAIQPDNVPTDRLSALQSAFSFVDQFHAALGDNKLSRAELNTIAQLGTNVSAGLNQHGGPALQGLSGKVNEITQQLARGQLPQARKGLGSFEISLGQRPSGFSQPGGGLPQPGGGLPQLGGGGLPKPGGGGLSRP